MDIMDNENLISLLKDNLSFKLDKLRDKSPCKSEVIDFAQNYIEQIISQIPLYKTRQDRLDFMWYMGKLVIQMVK